MSVPIPSVFGGARYVVVFVDEFTGAVFPYLMRSKGEVLSCLKRFHSEIAQANGLTIGRLRHFWDIARDKIVTSAHARIFERVVDTSSSPFNLTESVIRPRVATSSGWQFVRVRGELLGSPHWGASTPDGANHSVDASSVYPVSDLDSVPAPASLPSASASSAPGGVSSPSGASPVVLPAQIQQQTQLGSTDREHQIQQPIQLGSTDQEHALRSGERTPQAQYIADRVSAVLGKSVNDATQMVVTNSKGAACRYTRGDLNYDLARGYLRLDRPVDAASSAASLLGVATTTTSCLFSFALAFVGLQRGEPRHYGHAVRGPDRQIWLDSMRDELLSHEACGTYVPCPLPDGVPARNLIPLQWVYKVKQDQHGTPIRAKSRLVARGDRCIEGTHYSDVFAPVVHFTTARTFLSVCCQRGWSVQQMDVSTAFVNADLDRDDLYFELPPGGVPGVPDVDSSGRRMVLHARRALYGLPQSPRLWSQRLHHWLLQEGFTRCRKDPCYYIKREGDREVHLLVYVDDLAFAGNCPDMISSLRARLNADFKMTDMGQMSWFLGCEVVQDLDAGVTTLHQAKYVRDVVASRAQM